jgi:formylglycine-generating enzyme required for sulfatase activity
LRAFRGDKDWLLPWGDTYDVTWANVSDNPRFKRSTSPVKSTPKDVSLFGVYNLAGNASEFVRGTFLHRGRPYRMGKGGEYKGLGCIYAIAPMYSKYALDHSDPGVGIRCVVEEP